MLTKYYEGKVVSDVEKVENYAIGIASSKDLKHKADFLNFEMTAQRKLGECLADLCCG